MNWVFSFTLVCSNMVLTSCSNRDETVAPDKTYTGVPLVILDADIGSSTDDLFALEMLYRYDEQRLCRLLGVVVDREGEANADFTDVKGWHQESEGVDRLCKGGLYDRGGWHHSDVPAYHRPTREYPRRL